MKQINVKCHNIFKRQCLTRGKKNFARILMVLSEVLVLSLKKNTGICMYGEKMRNLFVFDLEKKLLQLICW